MKVRSKIFIILISLFVFTSFQVQSNEEKLLKYYPQIKEISKNTVIFHDGTSMIYDDGKEKTKSELLENPDIEDQFHYPYSKNATERNDCGRIRNEAFFKKIYGNSKEQVMKNLVAITWCPKLVGQKIMVSKVNGFDKVITKLSEELDRHKEYKKYLSNIAGTFTWRYIAGTSRLSNHSFGITIDINTKYSNYWQWDCKCSDEDAKLKYKNKIPIGLVEIFEKHGFIWGGRWEHYDTMHFEYRPEIQ